MWGPVHQFVCEISTIRYQQPLIVARALNRGLGLFSSLIFYDGEILIGD